MNDLLHNQPAATLDSVECLGQTFSNEDARREHFLNLLREKLKDPAFRNIEGFPIGTDEDILALSDPPFYTACPNPFVADFIRHFGSHYDPKMPLDKEPFAADVSEGKNDPIYNAHSYHTKVPPRAIVRYILNYTEPGDVVFDGFCGTGMTAVAAQLCGDKSVVQALGYRVDEDGTIFTKEDENGKAVWRRFSKIGARRAVLADLSPAATFIANSYNRFRSPSDLAAAVQPILTSIEHNCGWMYQTLHSPSEQHITNAIAEIQRQAEPDISKCGPTGRINYIVWSDVFSCPGCAGDIIFWDVAVDKSEGKVRETFACPDCDLALTKREIEPKMVTEYDHHLEENVTQRLQLPAFINYSFRGKRYEKAADKADRELATKIDRTTVLNWVPTYALKKGDKTGEPIRVGITHTHHFYTPRTQHVLSRCRAYGLATWAPFSALTPRATKMHRIAASRIGGAKKGEGGATVGIINGTLYVPSLSVEMNVLDQAVERTKAYTKAWFKKGDVIVSTQSSTSMVSLPNDSLDYVFIDPPFGANLMYSELNSLWEGWLRIFTQNTKEAIENKSQRKAPDDYRRLMAECFKEVFRVLKPGRWVTIEFSNTQASVWNSIQASLQQSGLVVANVSALDKKQGSFNAVTNATSVKQDLVISAYKPNGGLEDRFQKSGGNIDSVWDFARTHLSYLPSVKVKGGELEFIVERDPRIIFDRMVAWFVKHGFAVPVSSQEFQAGLAQRFESRDGMIFLSGQAAEYDKKRMQVAFAPQMEMFVVDERSAIDWISEFLKRRPSTYSEITPEYIPVVGAAKKKGEVIPELSRLLDDNFIQYDGNGEVPSQIHSYLSTNHKDLRGLEKSSPQLLAKAKDRWYVPDPNKAQDLEKKREKGLLREFETYQASAGRKLKEFRLEVLRAGFNSAWANKDYKTIIAISEKIPEDALQEDEKLLTLYDLALTRMESGA